MPTYEYACKACGERLEVVQSFSDDALTECPKCGGDLRKIFGNVGIAFKGSGFYKNDSREKKSTSKAAEPVTGTEGSASTSSPESKSGDKPASPVKESTSTTTTPAATPAAPSAPAKNP
jgi:putative FmdB family regulatory protein